VANPTFWGSPKAQRVKNLSFFGAFWVVFGPDLGSNRVAFGGLFGPGFGAYPKGPDFGPKSPYFRGFGGFWTLNPWALLALANETHPSCVPRHVFRGLGCLG